MITCPLCEHVQAAGAECEACGRPLAEGRGTDAPVAPLEGLEATGLGGGEGVVSPALLLDLEPTRQAAGADAPPEVVPGLEAQPARIGEVEIEATPDVERIGPSLADDPAPFPALATCRYCRTPAQPGDRLCARCGMALDRAPAAARATPGGRGRCTGCNLVAEGTICPACGGPLRPIEG